MTEISSKLSTLFIIVWLSSCTQAAAPPAPDAISAEVDLLLAAEESLGDEGEVLELENSVEALSDTENHSADKKTFEGEVGSVSQAVLVPPKLLDLPLRTLYLDAGYSGLLEIRNGCVVFVETGVRNGRAILPSFDRAKVEWDGERLITRDNVYSIGDRVRFGGNVSAGTYDHEICGPVASGLIRLK